jgi:hypothetical protein
MAQAKPQTAMTVRFGYWNTALAPIRKLPKAQGLRVKNALRRKMRSLFGADETVTADELGSRMRAGKARSVTVPRTIDEDNVVECVNHLLALRSTAKSSWSIYDDGNPDKTCYICDDKWCSTDGYPLLDNGEPCFIEADDPKDPEVRVKIPVRIFVTYDCVIPKA